MEHLGVYLETIRKFQRNGESECDLFLESGMFG